MPDPAQCMSDLYGSAEPGVSIRLPAPVTSAFPLSKLMLRGTISCDLKQRDMYDQVTRPLTHINGLSCLPSRHCRYCPMRISTMLCFEFRLPRFRTRFRTLTSLAVFRESAKPETITLYVCHRHKLSASFTIGIGSSKMIRVELLSSGSGPCVSAPQLLLFVVKANPSSWSWH